VVEHQAVEVVATMRATTVLLVVAVEEEEAIAAVL